MHTHYDNLKVTRGAPAEVIKAAYRALSQRYHPDRNPSPEAQRVMRLLNEAYAVLGDPVRRAAYDRELDAHERDESGSSFAEAGPGSWPPVDRGSSPVAAAAAAVAASWRQPIAPALGIAVTRCCARLFDVGWEVGVIGFLIARFLGRHWDAFSQWMSLPGNPLLFTMLCLPIAMVLDASVYRVAGNTPGKALLGLKVTALDGGALPWAACCRRSLAVWARGLGCGIPVVTFVTMWRRGREVSAGADAAYDAKTGHQVSAMEIGRVRKALFGGLCVGLFAAVPSVPSATVSPVADVGSLPALKAAAGAAIHARAHIAHVSLSPSPVPPPSSWTNPLTGSKATVEGIWRVSSAVDASQTTVYSFTAHDGRTAVMFADQNLPDLSMGDYVLAYLRSTASTMDLSPPDSVEHFGVSDTWIADGHLNDTPATSVRVELRHIGQSYWRVVIVRPAHVHVADEAVERLVQQLWGTVPGV